MLRGLHYSFLGLAVAMLAAGCDTVDPDTLLAPSLESSAKPRPLTELTTSGLEQTVTAQKIISHRGGILTIGNHSLIVPAGATKKPTLFVMRVLDGPGVRVRLTAYQVGDLTPIRSFENPLQLRLSYEGLQVVDPSRLRIFYYPDGVTAEYPVPSTVDPIEKTVTGLLHHFSDYSMGEA